jgi:hypothetical protein
MSLYLEWFEGADCRFLILISLILEYLARSTMAICLI